MGLLDVLKAGQYKQTLAFEKIKDTTITDN